MPTDLPWPRMTLLGIDPDRCIDCGACVDHCPVGAIFAEQDLPAEWGEARPESPVPDHPRQGLRGYISPRSPHNPLMDIGSSLAGAALIAT